MSDIEQWQQANERYLTAAHAWLLLLLERGATQARSFAPQLPPAADEQHESLEHHEQPEPLRRRLFRRAAAPAAEPPAARAPAMALLPPANITDNQIAEAAAAMAAAEAQADPPPALVILAQRLGLSDFERNVLLLCAAMEFNTRVAALCNHAQGGWGCPHPTFALALALFDAPSWDILSPERPLRFWRLIEINQPNSRPLTTSPLSADECIVNYIKGLSYIDDRLTPLLLSLEVSATPATLPPSQREQVEEIVRSVRQAAVAERLPVVQLLGPDTSSKRLIAWYAAGELGLNIYRLPVRLLPTQAAELETLARLWQRQSLLLPVSLYLDAHESASGAAGGEGQEQPAPPLNRFLLRSDGLFFLDVRDVWPQLDRASFVLDVHKPTPTEQQTAWAATLGERAGDNPLRLTSQFDLSTAEIQRIAASTLAVADPPPLDERLWSTCLLATRPRLDALAQRLEPKATWEDIVLPDEQLALLHQVADQVGRRGTVYDTWGFREKMNRGLGISALFSGPSGTGKTMAAEVLANELRLNLYRIDLSAVVSKYIGETEKNLRRLFDAAEDGGTLLFFDEADAIFGKRSEVKDAHDRYANIEINYLLQRMEAFRGLAILATNMKSALDQAFLRRLRFVVNFALPGLAERKEIWRKVFPAGVPQEGLDFEHLARLNLTGGNIHGIALNAAFLAARAGQAVTMPLVLNAARTELRKLERPINEADFRWQEPAKVHVA
ncbi:MAG: ATP-binding protein [Pyrinomonadaceae bacterium]